MTQIMGTIGVPTPEFLKFCTRKKFYFNEDGSPIKEVGGKSLN